MSGLQILMVDQLLNTCCIAGRIFWAATINIPKNRSPVFLEKPKPNVDVTASRTTDMMANISIIFLGKLEIN